MRRLLYIIVLVALLAVPVRRADVGNILPIELVMVYTKGNGVEIRTDTGNWGIGRNLEEAAKNMKDSASDELFLHTAQYLILSGEGISAEALRGMFKSDIYVCRGNREIDLMEAVEYLSEHDPEYRLKDVKQGIILPEIRKTANGYRMS